MSKGRFGEYGGQYIPETLMPAVQEVEEAYNKYSKDPDFIAELDDLLKNYAGRPSLLYEAKKMTEDLGGAKIYLKREAGGLKPHRLSQDQQRTRPGSSSKKNGQNPCHRRNRCRTARCCNCYRCCSDGTGM